MAGLYLTSAGVTYLGQLMDQAYQGKETGKGLSTNDFTTELLNKLNGIAAGAQANVLEVIKVNGKAIAISGKAVDIDLSAYALKTDIAEVIRFKGEAASYTALPDDPEEGDLYIVQTADPTHEIDEGEAVIWNGTDWVDVGGIFSVDLSDYAQVDHTHDIGDVTGLQDAMDAKATPADITEALTPYVKKTEADGDYAAKTHSHSISDVSGLQTALDAKATPTDITSALTPYVKKETADNTYAAKTHAHEMDQVTGLNSVLAAKLDASQFATKLSENLKPMTNEEIAAAFAARK